MCCWQDCSAAHIPAFICREDPESRGYVFQFPALAEFRFDKLIGLFVVGESQVGAVPQELLVGEPPTDGAQQHPNQLFNRKPAGLRAGRRLSPQKS